MARRYHLPEDYELPVVIRNQDDPATYEPVMRRWINRKKGHNKYINWAILEQCGWADGLRNILSFRADGNKEHKAWLHLFEINEVIYMEPYAEFMATWVFDSEIGAEEYETRPCISFRHQNETHQITLAWFANRLGLYKNSHLSKPIFRQGYISYDGIVDRNDFWHTFTADEGDWKSSKKASRFIDPVHRILHHLITKTIHPKTHNSGAVSLKDIQLMYSMFHHRNMQVAYLLAEAISTEQNSVATTEPQLGAFVTKLLRRMHILGDTSRYTRESESEEIGYKLLHTWELIRIQGRQLIIRANPWVEGSVDRTVPNVEVSGFRPDRRTETGDRRVQHSPERQDEDEPARDEEPAGGSAQRQFVHTEVPHYEPYHYYMGDIPGTDRWFAESAMLQNLQHFTHHAGEQLGIPPYPWPHPLIVAHREPRGAGSSPPRPFSPPPQHHFTQQTTVSTQPEQSTGYEGLTSSIFGPPHPSTYMDTSTMAWDQAVSSAATANVTEGIAELSTMQHWGSDLAEGSGWQTGPMIQTSTASLSGLIAGPDEFQIRLLSDTDTPGWAGRFTTDEGGADDATDEGESSLRMPRQPRTSVSYSHPFHQP